MQKFEVSGQSVPTIERWKQTDRWMDGADCITFLANAVGKNYNKCFIAISHTFNHAEQHIEPREEVIKLCSAGARFGALDACW